MQNSDHDFCSRQGTFLTAQGRWCYKTCHSFALGDHVVIPIEIEERIRSDSHWESLSLSAGRKARCAWNLDFISSTLWLSNFPTSAQERLRSHFSFDNATHSPRLLRRLLIYCQMFHRAPNAPGPHLSSRCDPPSMAEAEGTTQDLKTTYPSFRLSIQEKPRAITAKMRSLHVAISLLTLVVGTHAAVLPDAGLAPQCLQPYLTCNRLDPKECCSGRCGRYAPPSIRDICDVFHG